MPVGDKNKAIAGLGTHHIAIQARDWDASVKFYKEVMGMDTLVEFGSPERRAILLDIGDGSHMEIFEARANAPEPDDTHGYVPVMHFAFATTDISAALERVREAGMEITSELRTTDIGHLNITVAFFKGPDKELIELFQVNS